jgi:hypothetical protein
MGNNRKRKDRKNGKQQKEKGQKMYVRKEKRARENQKRKCE